MGLAWKASRRVVRVDEETCSEELSDVDLKQLGVIAKLYFGEERAPLSIIPRLGIPGDGTDVLEGLEVRAIDEDGAHAYDAWSYMTDSGTFFRAGTAVVVGEIIQYGFQPHHETEWGKQFAEAYTGQKR